MKEELKKVNNEAQEFENENEDGIKDPQVDDLGEMTFEELMKNQGYKSKKVWFGKRTVWYLPEEKKPFKLPKWAKITIGVAAGAIATIVIAGVTYSIIAKGKGDGISSDADDTIEKINKSLEKVNDLIDQKPETVVETVQDVKETEPEIEVGTF